MIASVHLGCMEVSLGTKSGSLFFVNVMFGLVISVARASAVVGWELLPLRGSGGTHRGANRVKPSSDGHCAASPFSSTSVCWWKMPLSLSLPLSLFLSLSLCALCLKIVLWTCGGPWSWITGWHQHESWPLAPINWGHLSGKYVCVRVGGGLDQDRNISEITLNSTDALFLLLLGNNHTYLHNYSHGYFY